MRTNEAIRKTVVELYLAGKTRNEIMATTGISSSQTIYKILNNAGVTGGERAASKNTFAVTITNPEIALWLHTQDIEKILTDAYLKTKLVYSQIEGSPEKSKIQEQKSRIADSRVEYRTIDVIFYDAIHNPIGGERVIINIGSEDLLSDIITELRNNKYPQAVEAFYDGCKYRIVF